MIVQTFLLNKTILDYLILIGSITVVVLTLALIATGIIWAKSR